MYETASKMQQFPSREHVELPSRPPRSRPSSSPKSGRLQIIIDFSLTSKHASHDAIKILLAMNDVVEIDHGRKPVPLLNLESSLTVLDDRVRDGSGAVVLQTQGIVCFGPPDVDVGSPSMTLCLREETLVFA